MVWVGEIERDTHAHGQKRSIKMSSLLALSPCCHCCPAIQGWLYAFYHIICVTLRSIGKHTPKTAVRFQYVYTHSIPIWAAKRQRTVKSSAEGDQQKWAKKCAKNKMEQQNTKKKGKDDSSAKNINKDAAR